MTENVPALEEIERVVVVTVDCLRWDFNEAYRELYPDGVWYRATPQGTFTAISHASLFTGVNPPRHGVYQFGDHSQVNDTLFRLTDSSAHSRIFQPDNDVGAGLVGNIADSNPEIHFEKMMDHDLLAHEPYDGEIYSDLEQPDFVSAVRDHELTFFHDWVVHTSGPGDDADWSYPMDGNRSAEGNRQRYRKTVDMSASAHKHFLNELRDAGLYEDTLFVVWGDHGQAMNEPPWHDISHSHHAEEAVSRTPIGFVSPLFDGEAVDLDTNARGVDVMPTLQTIMRKAGLRFDEPSHEYEGVDLTTFNGELAGYTMAGVTGKTGLDDAVRDAEFNFLRRDDGGSLYETYLEPDHRYRLEKKVEDTLRAQRLEAMYENVRQERDKLIVMEDPNQETLRDLGYME